MNKLKQAVLLSYISVASISAAIITPALPQIQQSFTGIGHGTLEWLVTIFLIGYMTAQLIYAPIANRFGRIFALRLGFSINIVGIIVCLLAVATHSFGLLLFGRLVTALGAAAGLSCTFILINELLDEHTAKVAMAFAVVAFTVGIGVAVVIGGVVTQYLSWKFLFLILLVHAVMILLSTKLFQETLTKPQAINIANLMSGYLEAFRSRRLVLYALLVGFVTVFGYCFSAAAPIIAQHNFHLTASQYSYWNIINIVGMLAGGLVAARLVKKIQLTTILNTAIVCIVCTLISFILFDASHSSSVLWFFMNATALYFFTSFIFPTASYFASNAIADRAHASSAMNFINMGSAVLMVAIMGYLPLTTITSFVVTISGFLLLVLMGFCLRKAYVTICSIH